jgi:hypothetical protein
MCSTEKGKKKRAKKSFNARFKTGLWPWGQVYHLQYYQRRPSGSFQRPHGTRAPWLFWSNGSYFFSGVIIVYANAGIYL